MRLFADVASRIVDPHLRRAFELAENGLGRTAPNPLVGCVLVADGRVVGEGFHPRAGEPHAEVFALAAAGASALGSTAYVTLEPCDHQGKTPPCTRALIDAGVSRAVIGMPDPNPEAGGGAARLRANGIEVEFASDAQPFELLNEGWLKRMRTGRPFVTAKVAISLDGHPALHEGRRASISGCSGAEVTRTLRSRVDAVLVGVATVISDDPELTVRDDRGVRAPRQPLRVVLVRSALPGADARILTDGLAPTLLLVPRDAGDADGLTGAAPHITVEHFDDSQGLLGALSVLGDLGVNDVLVEPGPSLLASLWQTPDALDALVTVTAGGMAGPGAPDLYAGCADTDDSVLHHRFVACEAGIVGDVSAVVWRADTQADQVT